MNWEDVGVNGFPSDREGNMLVSSKYEEIQKYDNRVNCQDPLVEDAILAMYTEYYGEPTPVAIMNKYRKAQL